MRPQVWFAILFVLTAGILAGCLSGDPLGDEDPRGQSVDDEGGYVPRVILGIPDSGINPYHELYYRPNLTEHPSTYIKDFPEDIQALDLSVGGDDYDTMFEADRDIWENVKENTWYWIPRTVFVAVYCEIWEEMEYCILDHDNMHGTGTTSSALMENKDALIAFKSGGSSIDAFEDGGIPVDIYSVSWGNIAPIPGHPDVFCLNHARAPLYVLAAGNDPRSTLIDCRIGDPALITVGGAYAQDNSQELLAANQAEVVSYYCRPTAQTKSASEMRESYCGTSFAAPTVAGALSKVLLAIREESGYTGGLEGDMVDPILGITTHDLRGAMNQTATYDPEAQYDNTFPTRVPLNSEAPWIQWGWGFYDGLVAEETIQLMLGFQTASEKSADAEAWMQNMHDLKKTLYT